MEGLVLIQGFGHWSILCWGGVWGGGGGGQLRGEVRGRWGGCQFGSSLGSLLAPFEEVVLPGITLVVV